MKQLDTRQLDKITLSKCDMVKQELRVTSCQLRVKSLQARVEILLPSGYDSFI